jgi:Ser/Thr protein kinase RdoA (MazF antagonist)
MTSEDRQWLGRFLGRIHAIGRRGRFQHRARLDIVRGAEESKRFLQQEGWIPEHLEAAYDSITRELIARMRAERQTLDDLGELRLHGDCHLGNVLWVEGQGPHFVDLDDCMTGPAIQDFWMLLSGSRDEQALQLREIVEGYSQFADFDYRELALIETLRTLRQMNYAAWLARRWSDPAFPKAFPWFGEPRFWERHVLDLREQLAALDEPILALWD